MVNVGCGRWNTPSRKEILLDPDSAAALDRWLALLIEAHADRILPIDRAIAEEWGRMSVPDPLPVVDGLLAATAQVLGLTLVTRNVADVEDTGVELLDPFSATY